MNQDSESAFGRGFRNGYGASDSAQDHDNLEIFPAQPWLSQPPPAPVDYTGAIGLICGTVLLVALIAALCFLKRKPDGS